MDVAVGVNSMSEPGPCAPKICDYLEYRCFLRDFYLYKRALTAKDVRPYTYAMFSAAADIRSPNYLKLVIDGQRNLSEAMAEKFAKAMGLSKADSLEFVSLVLYTQSFDPIERSRHLKHLSQIRVQAKMDSGEIDSKRWDSIPSWISWMLLQLLDVRVLKLEPVTVSKLLEGKVSPEIVRKALDGLIEVGMLEKDEATGELKPTKQYYDSPFEMPPDMIRKLQTELILLGLDSLFKDSPKEREFGTVTMSLTRDEFEKVKFEVRHMRKRWQREFSDRPHSGKPERLYQFNVQLFPLSQEIQVINELAGMESAPMTPAQTEVQFADEQPPAGATAGAHPLVTPVSENTPLMKREDLPAHHIFTPENFEI